MKSGVAILRFSMVSILIVLIVLGNMHVFCFSRGMEIDSRGLALDVAREGVVLLKNDGILPLPKNVRIALFGSAQNLTWWYHNLGSAYVSKRYSDVYTILKALIGYGASIDVDVSRRYYVWPFPGKTNEYPFREDEIRDIASRNDVAIIVLSRVTGEDLDMDVHGRWVKPGWWFQYYDTKPSIPQLYVRGWHLEKDELDLIHTVSRYFNGRVILILNTPGPIELEPVVDRAAAILWVGYPGEMGGRAVVDILFGDVSPSGKLPFTWARKIGDYPTTRCFGSQIVIYCEHIYLGYRYFDTFNISPLYPFGYGLSYTRFSIDVISVSATGDNITLTVMVSNIGSYPGKEVVQVYVSPPIGRIEKPYQVLAAFAKTDLLKPGERQVINISFRLRDIASYDEDKSSWVLEKGIYIIRVGNSSRSTHVEAIAILPRDIVVEKTLNRLRPWYFYRIASDIGIDIVHRSRDTKTYGYRGEDEEISRAQKIYIDPDSIKTIDRTSTPPYTPEVFRTNITMPITLRDVALGRSGLDDLVAQMPIETLVNITIGLREHRYRYIPELRQADGPNGIRQGPSPNPGGTAFPAEVVRAATWNRDLEYMVGRAIGLEMVYRDISIWLAPGINMHRNPLGGRNAEYYSEDPLLAGSMAISVVRGVQSVGGIGVCMKHFVANDQESYRSIGNSVVSERALREIYLKPFEIATKFSRPWCIMTSYNMVNNIFTGNDFNLTTAILRGEWGFDGFVMTDWWSRSYNYRAYLAGNDALMPYTSSVREAPWAPWANMEVVMNDVRRAISNSSLSIAHLQRSAYNILRVAMRSRAFAKIAGLSMDYIYDHIYRYEPPKQDIFTIAKSIVTTQPTTLTTYIAITTKKTITIYTTYTITTTIYIPSTTTIIHITSETSIDIYATLLISITLFIIGLAISYTIRISRR